MLFMKTLRLFHNILVNINKIRNKRSKSKPQVVIRNIDILQLKMSFISKHIIISHKCLNIPVPAVAS